MLALPNCSGPCMNVLYLLSDDMRADLGAYGLPTKTPNLDRLAAEGLLFTHAYCQMSVCSPSRQSFMTSRRPDTNGVWNFIDTRDPDDTLWTLRLLPNDAVQVGRPARRPHGCDRRGPLHPSIPSRSRPLQHLPLQHQP